MTLAEREAGGEDELHRLLTGQTERVQDDHSSLKSPRPQRQPGALGGLATGTATPEKGVGHMSRRCHAEKPRKAQRFLISQRIFFVYRIDIATQAVAKRARRNISKVLGTSPRSP